MTCNLYTSPKTSNCKNNLSLVQSNYGVTCMYPEQPTNW